MTRLTGDHDTAQGRLDLLDVLHQLDQRSLNAERRSHQADSGPEANAAGAEAHAYAGAIDLLEERLGWLAGKWRRESPVARGAGRRAGEGTVAGG